MAWSQAITVTPAAGDIKLQSRLIWGTNDDKSPDPLHKPLNPNLAKRLAKVFKWKNYFEVKQVAMNLPASGKKRVRLSPKCELEITDLGAGKLEVKLFGEGKPVNRTVKALKKGELLTIGGEDKGENSWFVVVTLI